MHTQAPHLTQRLLSARPHHDPVQLRQAIGHGNPYPEHLDRTTAQTRSAARSSPQAQAQHQVPATLRTSPRDGSERRALFVQRQPLWPLLNACAARSSKRAILARLDRRLPPTDACASCTRKSLMQLRVCKRRRRIRCIRAIRIKLCQDRDRGHHGFCTHLNEEPALCWTYHTHPLLDVITLAPHTW